MNSYNGYSGKERETKLRELHRLERAGSPPTAEDHCMLCGDPGVHLEPHSEDYSQPFLWSVPAVYWLCRHCHRHKVHTRFERPNPWRAFLLHVRRGGYARDLEVATTKHELDAASRDIAAGKTPELSTMRPRLLTKREWWEDLTLCPESRDDPRARPRP